MRSIFKRAMLLAIFFGLLSGTIASSVVLNLQGLKNSRSNDNKSPEEVIEDLEMAIIRAEKEGNYRCCIEPACTMCYLGHWKFEKGTCYCDDAIAEGRDEDVCPECVKGIEKGLCKSTIDEEKCDIGSGANFKLIDS